MRIPATPTSDSELELYLQEISRYPLLKPHEERELAYRIAKGDQEAQDHMIRSNLRLVVSIAKNYLHRGMSLLDLIEEGNLGLLKAVSRFSPDQGCKFSTYASWWIKQTIRRALINKVKSVRVPAYMVEILTHWRKKGSELSQKLGREPTAEEIGRALHLRPAKLAAIRQALSASAPTGRGGGERSAPDVEDLLAGLPSREEAGVLGEYDREALAHALEYALTERERHILEMRYGLAGEEPHTLETIGERIGLTRERVRQIENQALHKLQIFLRQKDEQDAQQRLERRRRRGRATAEGAEPAGRAAPSGRRGKRKTVVLPKPKAEEAPEEKKD